jgi:hypothetical protein
VARGEVLEQVGNFLTRQATFSSTAMQLTVANSEDVPAWHQIVRRKGAVFARARACVCVCLRPVRYFTRRLMYCRTDLSTDCWSLREGYAVRQ